MTTLSDTRTLQGYWSPLVPPDLDTVMAMASVAHPMPERAG